uniref:Ig-like domain-containing protein n=1 Tax=Malurus cyaneus samueli TaxID=2593467 RepID=A0A8C5U579_9PASS
TAEGTVLWKKLLCHVTLPTPSVSVFTPSSCFRNYFPLSVPTIGWEVGSTSTPTDPDCKASGWPVPRLSWALPDGTRLSTGLAHAGLYTCYAHNALGSAEMRIQLTVLAAAPRIKHKDKTSRLTVTAGDAALLDCEADGEPRPWISWLLPSGDTISSSAERLSLHPNGSLSIAQAGPPDAGQYVCAARNPGGADTKLYELRVAPKPPTINGLHAGIWLQLRSGHECPNTPPSVRSDGERTEEGTGRSALALPAS